MNLNRMLDEIGVVAAQNDKTFQEACNKLKTGTMPLDDYRKVVLQLLDSYYTVEKKLTDCLAMSEGIVKKKIMKCVKGNKRVIQTLSQILRQIDKGEVFEDDTRSND